MNPPIRPQSAPRRPAPWPGFLLFLASLLAAGSATARTETLQWRHSAPERVLRFEAHVGPSSGSFDRVIDLGVPAPDGSGIYSAAITVGDSEDVRIALRAVGNDGTLSSFSITRTRSAAAPSDPPPSDPPPSDPPPSTPPPSEDPVPGAIHYDFESGSNWRSQWVDTGANHSLTVQNGLFSVTSTGLGGVLSTSSTANDIHSHAIQAGPGNSYAVHASLSASSANSGIGVTAYSSYPDANRYYRLGREAGGNFRITGPDPFACASGSPDTRVPFSPGASYMVELRIERGDDSNRLEATVWEIGTTRPPLPQATCVDDRPSRPIAGAAGVWASGEGSKFWDDLEIRPFNELDAPLLIRIDRID